jgi:hypothetical protein
MTINLNHKPYLTKKQLYVLTLIYEFRFVNSKHIKVRLNQKLLSQPSRNIGLLHKNGYMGRIWSGKDRLNGTHAVYYLLPLGIQVLRANKPTANPKVLKNIYNDQNASKDFVKRCLVIGDINCELVRLFAERMTFFTRSNMRKYDYFPNPLPDGYIPIRLTNDNFRYFFLDFYGLSPLDSIARRRIRQYVQYAESKEWENNTGSPFPTILMVFETSLLQKIMLGYVQRTINRSESLLEHLTFMATTLDKLKAAKDSEEPIWQKITGEGVEEEDECLIA